VVRIGVLATLDGWTALAVLPTVHALSRATAVGVLGTLPPATDEGLGSSYANAVTRSRVGMALATALLIGAAVSGLWVAPAAVLAGLAGWLVGGLSLRKLGGITGDILGGVQQLAEIATLLLGAIFVANGWPSPAWWR
jgi:adenosylcobinamide-GDP ribazoletransferase